MVECGVNHARLNALCNFCAQHGFACTTLEPHPVAVLDATLLGVVLVVSAVATLLRHRIVAALTPRLGETDGREPVALTVLLGATQAGKTSLMRLMAGLDTPTEGRVWADGKDVTGMGVRERNVAMVYQQFINYPSLSVFENIASPLRIAGKLSEDQIKKKVSEMAERLHISKYLDRSPAALSGHADFDSFRLTA